MFHHRFIKQKEALGFSLSFLIYRFVGGFPFASFFTALPFFRGCPFASSFVALSFFRGCSFASSFVALSSFRGCSLASFLSLHRSSEVFFCLFFCRFTVLQRLLSVPLFLRDEALYSLQQSNRTRCLALKDCCYSLLYIYNCVTLLRIRGTQPPFKEQK